MNSTAEEMNVEFEKEVGRKPKSAGGSDDTATNGKRDGTEDFRRSGKA